MADTKQTKTIGEHYVAAEIARRGWAPAFTRDGLARTDILAVKTDGTERRMIEVQVKAARGPRFDHITWPLGLKSQQPALQEGEYFVLVAIPTNVGESPRFFIVPRDHVAAAAYIGHQAWLHDPSAEPGTRRATLDQSRVSIPAFARYEDRWDLLDVDQSSAPVLLPVDYHALATRDEIGLPPGHPWTDELPSWS
ncbi:hypothetical protein [Clavibacter sp. VKM Ac-2873]|uniref:hypothetical protein n=1 Tax=Clavibacter sp. VKM Ac-2873 TaxID=2783813 RepID=UPI001E44EB0D|nr:hypothetical protein [Clavibacter sp. VKM Ac-2873]